MAIVLGVTSIYGLVDPRTGAIRYVGRSDDPELRLKRHCLYHSNSRKSVWIQELQALGLQPQLRILENVAQDEALRREVEWIRKLFDEGAELTNSKVSSSGKVTIKSSTDPLKRFWKKVNKQGPIMPGMTTRCWLWTGQTMRGYGQFGSQNENGQWQKGPAHRWLWKQVRGHIDDDLVLDHQCENRSCVRPDHLEPATRVANTMRGKSPHAVNARKTHCPRGHAYTEDNIYLIQGQRRCRVCNIASVKRGYAERMANPANRAALSASRRERRRQAKLLTPPAPKEPRATCRRGHLWVPENEDWYQNARHCKQCRLDRTKHK